MFFTVKRALIQLCISIDTFVRFIDWTVLHFHQQNNVCSKDVCVGAKCSKHGHRSRAYVRFCQVAGLALHLKTSVKLCGNWLECNTKNKRENERKRETEKIINNNSNNKRN